jgi:hypothetical protein
MKRMSRGISQREAKEGSTLTVRRPVAARRTHGLGGDGDLVEGVAHPLREGPPRRGERDTLAAAREERGAEEFLQRAHLVAHRPVGDVQLLGGAREALEARGGLERAQRGKRGRRWAICECSSQEKAKDIV